MCGMWPNVFCNKICFACVCETPAINVWMQCGILDVYTPVCNEQKKKKERQFHVKIQMSVACVVVSVVFMWRMFALGRQGAGTSSLIYVMRCLYV